MNKYVGKMLLVDLSSGKITKESPDEALIRDYIGGRGVNARLAYEYLKPNTDPLSAENVLLLGAGPLGGTLAPASNRLSLAGMSPLTSILGYTSVGGVFAPVLRCAGYDHIVFTGKSPEPVYLWIDDDHVELKRAKHLWGKGVTETVHEVRRELESPDAELLTIGPAGENLVRFACVVGNFHRVAGRTGMGAVMGSKNLKAIAVRGTGTVEVARRREFIELAKAAHQKIRNSVAYADFSQKGTSSFVSQFARLGFALVRNWQQIGDVDEVSQVGYEGQSKYLIRSEGCYSCPVHCSHRWEIKDGPYAGERGSGMEYGVVIMLSQILGSFYVPAAFKGMKLINDYGMDSFEFGSALAAAYEWYEKGIITKKDSDGIPLEWGNHEAMLDMIHRIGRREGFGDVLAEGAVRAAAIIGKGAEKYVSHCKGMTIHGADYRLMKGTTLAIGVCNKGADVMDAVPEGEGYTAEERKMYFGSADRGDPLSYEGKAKSVYRSGINGMIADLLQICKFNTIWLFPGMLTVEDMARLYSAATGIEVDKQTLRMVAERVHMLERAFQARAGISKKDDSPKGPLGEQPVTDGPSKGERIDPEKHRQALEEYYEVAGWDKQTGVPTRAKLEELGLGFVADDLEREGKL